MEKLRSKPALALAVCLIIVFSTMVTYAAFSVQHIFFNILSTDSVDIELSQLEMADGKEVPLKGCLVTPGQNISYIPRVTNKGADCYIRVIFEVDMNSECAKAISLDDISHMNDEWVKRGDSFYCKRILKKGESSDVFEGITVPSEWKNGDSSSFTITASAQAIQAANVYPDFESILPWGSIGIEGSSLNKTVCGKAVTIPGDEIIFNSGGSFECATDDLFSEFETLLPGDVYKKSVPVKNKSGRGMDVYFRTDNEMSKLLETIDLSISCDGQMIYQGTLVSKELRSFIKVMNIPAGKEGLIDFQISMPPEAGNEYSKMNDQVKWILAAEYDNESRGIVRTGDLMNATLIVLLLTLMITSAVMGYVLMKNRRKR